MKEDFFSVVVPYLSSLNETELKIFDYVAQNMHAVKDKSIRILAHECYVSTTTIFRFVQKLGFAGYADFINSLRLADYPAQETNDAGQELPNDWIGHYSADITQSLRSISPDKIAMLLDLIRERRIVLLSDSLAGIAAEYAQRMFCLCEYHAERPVHAYELKGLIHSVEESDVLMVFSTAEQSREAVETVTRILADKRPAVISVSNEHGGILQRMSDLNIPVYSQQSPVAAMIAVIDLIFYHLRQDRNNQDTEVISGEAMPQKGWNE